MVQIEKKSREGKEPLYYIQINDNDLRTGFTLPKKQLEELYTEICQYLFNNFIEQNKDILMQFKNNESYIMSHANCCNNELANCDYKDGIYLCYEDGYKKPFPTPFPLAAETTPHGLVTHIGIKVGEHKVGLKLNSLSEHRLPYNSDLDSDDFDYKEQEFYALDDYDGEANTDHIERHGEFEFDLDDDEWIPSLGELTIIFKYKDKLNDALTFVGGDKLVEDWYWSSTEGGANITWFMNFSNGNVYSVYKFNNNIIRPVCAF